MTNLKETILNKIKEDKLSMRPRVYFVAKVVLLILLSLGILFVSIFILNFILFSIRLNSQDELLGFGPRGIGAFLLFFPWMLFLIDVALIAVLQAFVRRFKFGYRIPVLYLVGGIFLVALLLGFAFDRGTDWNDRMLRRAEQRHLPPALGGFYGNARRPVPPRNGICKCTVVEIGNSMLVVEDLRFGTTTRLSIMMPMNNPRATTTDLKIGDVVFIAGDNENGVIKAFGVRKLRKPVEPQN